MSKMVHEDTVGSAGSEGGGAMGSTVREGPSERVRGSSTLEDGQDVVDTELSGRKPFQENNRPFDFYSSLISVAGLFKTKTVSYTHLTLPTKTHQCRSRWSPYH